MNPLHHIVRIDIPGSNTHGWQVKVRRQGKRMTKFFGDRRYGGSQPALQEAIVYRDDLLERLPEPDDGTTASRLARTSSGIPGLRFEMTWDGNQARIRKPYLIIDWVDADGRRRRRTWSLNKHKLRAAVWNACKRLHAETIKAGREIAPAGTPEQWYEIAFPKIKRQYLEAIPEGARVHALETA